MQGSSIRSLSIGVGLCLGACGGQHDQELRLSEELGRARADAAWHAARAAELDTRLSQLEQRVASGTAGRKAGDRELLDRLDRVIELNDRLLAERPTTSTEPQLNPTQTEPETEAELEAQVRSLVERLRGRGGRLRGPLTREQNEALRVLLKPERQLDSESPWPRPWY